MTPAATYTWDGFDATAVARMFDLSYAEMLAEVDSTMDVAHERAARGVGSRALIVADVQRSGRGRMGRSWSSEPQRGVWSTMIVRPEPRALDVLSLRVGLAIAERLDAFMGARVGVKWPNDLMARDRKLGGILTEARWSGDALSWVAIGVGVNVQAPSGLPEATGFPDGVRRIDVLRAIVDGVDAARTATGVLSDIELHKFRQRDVLRGRRLEAPGRGTARGVSPEGALLIEADGRVESFRSGTVQLAEDA